MRRFVFMFAAVCNLLLLDQIAKTAAEFYLKSAPPRVLVPGFLQLAYVENRGCAWGMLQGHVWPLAVFGIVALIFLAWKRRSVFPPGFLGAAAETLLYAGIIGNVIDRLHRGFVIDMIDFHWGVRHFPCFNVADICISVSAGLLILLSFRSGANGQDASSPGGKASA